MPRRPRHLARQPRLDDWEDWGDDDDLDEYLDQVREMLRAELKARGPGRMPRYRSDVETMHPNPRYL